MTMTMTETPTRAADTVRRTTAGVTFAKPPAETAGEAAIRIRDANLWYGRNQALYDITMDIPARQATAFIGPSGCGKSTLLRCLNRMNDLIDNVRITGEVKIGGENIYSKDIDVIELRKRVGMVFQRSNPFPKSIYENISYGLRLHGRKNSELDA